MNVVEFLEQLKSISLEENEKENQILSQKENEKRSSGPSGSKVPFTQWEKMEKSKKKITFLLTQEPNEASRDEMEDSLGLQLQVQKPKVKKLSSKISTNQTLNWQQLKEKKPRQDPITFPQNYEEQMKMLRTLR